MPRPLELRSLATIGTQEPRKPSGTGINHIMMRGINQNPLKAGIVQHVADYDPFVTYLSP